ncbi:MAG: PQQ-binding-like beta-propeller repeat protein [Vicinamibacterales bacterium]|jgi:quinoprotein glucose dehydrogenase|nr:PQQ-binding-like beta-propeller repeat protein [Vicinamibacterales bacterium]
MLKPAVLRVLSIIASGVTLTPLLAVPAAGGQSGEWHAYAADKASTKYTPLDQVDASTVHDLRIVWRQSTIPDATRLGNTMRTPSASQNTPLMAGGRLFISTGLGMVAALDATSGEVVWFDAPRVPEGEEPRRGSPTRGLGYWTDGDDARILAVLGSRLVALDAETGVRYPDFGEGGEVDLVQGFDDRVVERFRWRSAPLVVNDVIIVGSLIGDITSNTIAALKEMPPGDVRGFDVRTGEQLWIFHTIPREGEPGNETWLTALTEDRASWEYTGNTNMWASPSADEELGYVYLPLSTPTSDYYGGHRPGDNLFAESLVCLDAETGERIWHFQAVHHGLWDYDFPAAPTLLDITVDGREIKAVAIASKQATTYVFDRVTGEPVWPVEERPVPQGDVPGEWYAATQPIPTKPPPYDQRGVTIDDLIDFTPELRAEAVAMLDEYVWGPFFTPPSLIDDRPGGTQGTLVVPGLVGGTDWNGAGADPETGILYVPSNHSGTVVGLGRSENPRSDVDWVMTGARHIPGPQGLPMFKPPYGRLVAIDLNAGEILWSVANGDGPRDNPAIAHLDLPPLGHGGRAAPLITKSLVFMGEGANVGAAFLPEGSGGKMFRAYDKATGAVVWEMVLPGGTTAAPISYMVDGTQYIVVTVGWEDMESEYVALALPQG